MRIHFHRRNCIIFNPIKHSLENGFSPRAEIATLFESFICTASFIEFCCIYTCSAFSVRVFAEFFPEPETVANGRRASRSGVNRKRSFRAIDWKQNSTSIVDSSPQLRSFELCLFVVDVGNGKGEERKTSFAFKKSKEMKKKYINSLKILFRLSGDGD